MANAIKALVRARERYCVFANDRKDLAMERRGVVRASLRAADSLRGRPGCPETSDVFRQQYAGAKVVQFNT